MAWHDVWAQWLPQGGGSGPQAAQALAAIGQTVQRTQSSLMLLQGKGVATAWGLARMWAGNPPQQAARVWRHGVEETMSHHRQLQAILASGQRDLVRAADQLIASSRVPALSAAAAVLRTTAASWSLPPGGAAQAGGPPGARIGQPA